MNRKKNVQIMSDWTKQDDRLLQEISKRRLDRVRSLIVKDHVIPTKINAQTGTSAFHQAASKGDLDTIDVLLDCKADVNSRDVHGRTALHCAAGSNAYVTQRLLQCQPTTDVTAVDHSGLSVLHHAVLGGNLDCVKLLLEQHAPVHSKDKNGRSPLSHAAEHGQASTCRLLLQHGADIDDRDYKNRTALTMAAEKGHPAVCDYLIRQGADVTIKTSDGLNALIIASKSKSPEVVKILDRAMREKKSTLRNKNSTENANDDKTSCHRTSASENEYEEMPSADAVARIVTSSSSEKSSQQATVEPDAASLVRVRNRLPTPDDETAHYFDGRDGGTDQLDSDSAQHTYNELRDINSEDELFIRGKIAKYEREQVSGEFTDHEGVNLSLEDTGSLGRMISHQLSAATSASRSTPATAAVVDSVPPLPPKPPLSMYHSDSELNKPHHLQMFQPLHRKFSDDVVKQFSGDKATLVKHESSPNIPSALQEVEIGPNDVELLPQIISELEAEKAGVNKELEAMQVENEQLKQSNQDIEKKYSLVVNSHQWLVQELCQILKLVETFRHELAARSAPDATADTSSGHVVPNDDVVDAGLQQIERLLGALVRLDGEMQVIEESDVYGCYDADIDRLASAKRRLERTNQTLDYQLHQALRENLGLAQQVEELEHIADAACHLQEEHDVIKAEYQRIVESLAVFQERISNAVAVDQPMELERFADVFNQTLAENDELRRAVEDLVMKVDELEEECRLYAITESTESGNATNRDELVLKCSQLNGEVGDLRRAVTAKDEIIKELTQTKSELLNKVNEMEVELKCGNRSMSELEATLAATVGENKRLLVAKEYVAEKWAEYQANVDQSNKEQQILVEDLTERNEKLLLENQRLKSESDAFTESRNVADDNELTKKDELQQLKEEKRILEEEVERLNEAIGRQSQMILNMDEKLREQDCHVVESRGRTNVQSDSKTGNTQAAQSKHFISAECQTVSEDKQDEMRMKLEQIIAAKGAIEKECERWQSMADDARAENSQLQLTNAQLKIAANHRKEEIDEILSNARRAEENFMSDLNSLKEQLQELKRERDAEIRRLKEENENLKAQMQTKKTDERVKTYSSSQNEHLTPANTRPATFDEPDSVKISWQNVPLAFQDEQNVSVTKLTKFSSAEIELSKSMNIATTPFEQCCDGGNTILPQLDEADSVEKSESYERQLVTELANAIEVSQSLIDENRSLRQQIEHFQHRSGSSATALEGAPVASSELENKQLKTYVKRLESEVKELQQIVSKQTAFLEENCPAYSADGLRPKDTGDLQATREASSVHGGNDGKLTGVERRKVGYISPISTPSRQFADQEVQCVDFEREDASAENFEDTIRLLMSDREMIRSQLELSQTEIEKLESQLTSNTENFNKLHAELKLAHDAIKKFDQLAKDVDVLLKPYQDGRHEEEVDAMNNGESKTLLRLQKLFSESQILLKEKEELLDEVRSLQASNSAYEISSQRDRESVRTLSETVDSLQCTVNLLRQQQLIQNDEEKIKSQQEADVLQQQQLPILTSTPTRIADQQTSSETVETEDPPPPLPLPPPPPSPPVAAADINAIPRQDVIASLTAENEALRRLLESRAPQLAPDFEERLMAEIERLSTECQQLRVQLATCEKQEAEKFDKTSPNEINTDFERLGTYSTVQTSVADQLKRENDHLRAENKRLSDVIKLNSATMTSIPTGRTSELKKDHQEVDADIDCHEDNDSVVERGGSSCSGSTDLEEDHVTGRTVKRLDSSGFYSVVADHQPTSEGKDSGSDVIKELRFQCRQLEADNQALRDRITKSWKVSVQHAVSRSVAVQTNELSAAGYDVLIEGVLKVAADSDINWRSETVKSQGADGRSTAVTARTTAVNEEGSSLDAGHLVIEIRRLTKLLAETERNKQEMIRAYRRHLLQSVQGRIDPSIKETLLHIIHTRNIPVNNVNNADRTVSPSSPSSK